jgi:hypothetical protein
MQDQQPADGRERIPMNTETIRLLETIRQLLADTLTHADAIGEHVIAANVSMALELTAARLGGKPF